MSTSSSDSGPPDSPAETVERSVPKGRFGRLFKLAGAGARTGMSFLHRGDGSSGAKKTAEILGQLRGIATKMGQMASYVDGIAPPQHREAYERWMKSLREATPSSSPKAVRALVEEELGAPLETLFVHWQERPIASASIGQVHRATLRDGRTVAVKVQHPGIVEAVENDLHNAGLLEAGAAMLGARRFDSKGVLQVIRDRFREELDYLHEAERQRQFAEIHADSPTICIPEVIDDHTSRRVLTTAFVEGSSFETACASDLASRTAWCETLWRFVYKAVLVGGMFNADPHPGNYFFHADGRVTFIDFGCVQPLGPRRKDLARQLHCAAHERDEETFREVAKVLFETRGGEYERAAISYIRSCFEPHFSSPFRITRPYVTYLVEEMKRMVHAFRRSKDDGFVPLPPEVFFLNRLQFGFYSVMARLDAEMDFERVERAFL